MKNQGLPSVLAMNLRTRRPSSSSFAFIYKLSYQIYFNDQKSLEQFAKLNCEYGSNLEFDKCLIIKWRCAPEKK
jgi:hypothetical protein